MCSLNFVGRGFVLINSEPQHQPHFFFFNYIFLRSNQSMKQMEDYTGPQLLIKC